MKTTINIYKSILNAIGVALMAILMLPIQSCSVEEVSPTENFVKIYNNELFDVAYEPLDIKQNSDGGFIILGKTGENATYLLRTDESGLHVADTLIESPYVHPLSELFLVGSDYYFFSMDDVTLSTHLLRVNESDSNQIPEVISSFPSIVYPLHASQTPDGGFIVQSYDRDAQSTVLTKLNADFGQTWQNSYEVLEDAEPSIISKFAGTSERDLPFFTGSTTDGGTYFLNGFYNFSLSLLFVNAGDGELIGTLNGLREETGVSAVSHISADQYALARYSFDENYIVPGESVSPQSNLFSGEIGGNEFPEIEPQARVIIKRVTIDGKDVTVYGTVTQSKQIALYFYDETDGSLINTRYFGNTNPYDFGNFTLTEDGGMAIVGKTSVAGRFPRIALFKISASELSNLIN